MEKTYWNRNGKHQAEHDQLWEKLVPYNGTATTKAGELLRAMARVYHRWFNDGDRIEPVLSYAAADSSTVNGWGFLYKYRDGDFTGSDLALALLAANSKSEYETKLEEMADAVIAYVAQAPEVPNDSDFLDREFATAYPFETEEEDDGYDEYFDEDDDEY